MSDNDLVPADIESSLVAAIASDEVVSIATEAAELALDANMVDGLSRDIPIVGTLVSVAKVGLSVRDTLFVRKLLKFLRGIGSVPPELRRDMVQRLESDPSYGRKVGEHLMAILEKIDVHRKPEMTARIFAAYVDGRVDALTMHRLNHAVELLPFFEIDSLRKIEEEFAVQGKFSASDSTCHALENAGLMGAQSAYGGLAYSLNDLSEIFLHLELDRVGK